MQIAKLYGSITVDRGKKVAKPRNAVFSLTSCFKGFGKARCRLCRNKVLAFFQNTCVSTSAKSKKLTFVIFKKNHYCLFISGYMFRPQVSRGARIWSPFRVSGPKRIVTGSGVWGSEGDNSPFRGARPKLVSYSDSRTRNPTPHISWYPQVFFGGFAEPKSISARAGAAVPAKTGSAR